MENVLQGIPKVTLYIDDILIMGTTDEEHPKMLAEVLRRLKKTANMAKFKFLVPSVTYLGHRIDHSGLHPLAEKVQAVQNAPDPHNVSELKAHLGLLTYYCKYIPNMATVLAPLYKLLRKEVPWRWSATEEKKLFKLLRTC